ncbi:MAG: DMT family transporter [Ferruginibacter sp.]
MTSKTKAHIALLSTNIFFAMNFTAVKSLLNDGLVKPFGLNLIRVGFSMILLWILFLFKPVKSVIYKKDIGRFVLCALTGIAVNQLFFIQGLSFTSSIHASLLLLTTPILITIIAAWFLKERLNRNKIIGLTLGITGAVILVSQKGSTVEGENILLGDILIILNAISYTIYFILVKPLMAKYDPVVVIRMVFTIGFFMILPFGWNDFIEVPWQQYNTGDYLLLILIVFFGTFLAYLLNLYGIKTLGASMAGTYIYSQPVFAAIIAIIFLGETLSWYKILSAALIFGGVYLTNKASRND